MTDRLHEYKRLLVLGLPILAGQLGNIATGFADNIMLGHYDTDALAAASFCNNVFNLAILCSLGFAYGLTPTVSSLFARGAFARIGNVMRNAVLFNVLYTVMIMVAMGVMYLNIHRLGQPEALLPLMRPYFVLCLVGLLPLAFFNVMAQWSYGIGNTAMPMWIILGGNVINVVGNWALIYGNLGCSEMGLIGAGIATLTSRVLCAGVICLIFLLAKRYRVYSRAARAGRLERRTLAAIWRTSVPVSMQLTFETAAFSGAAIFVGMLGYRHRWHARFLRVLCHRRRGHHPRGACKRPSVGKTGPAVGVVRLPYPACRHGGGRNDIRLRQQIHHGTFHKRP